MKKKRQLCGTMVRCRQKCTESFPVPHGYITCSGASYEDDTCAVHCYNDYKLKGDSKVYCHGGVWTKQSGKPASSHCEDIGAYQESIQLFSPSIAINKKFCFFRVFFTFNISLKNLRNAICHPFTVLLNCRRTLKFKIQLHWIFHYCQSHLRSPATSPETQKHLTIWNRLISHPKLWPFKIVRVNICFLIYTDW